ncbi:MAG: hypothetical protein IJ594_08745, partial [Oscillospiraceae bacterium]|nr:hypothetical protein [Oscillospiraceae bacterium]
ILRGVFLQISAARRGGLFMTLPFYRKRSKKGRDIFSDFPPEPRCFAAPQSGATKSKKLFAII